MVKKIGSGAIKCKLNIFEPSHIGTVVEVFDVQSHEARVGDGKITV